MTHLIILYANGDSVHLHVPHARRRRSTTEIRLRCRLVIRPELNASAPLDVFLRADAMSHQDTSVSSLLPSSSRRDGELLLPRVVASYLRDHYPNALSAFLAESEMDER